MNSLFRFNIPITFHWPFSKAASVTVLLSSFQFFDANYGGQEYDALEMRGGEEVGSATKPPSRVRPFNLYQCCGSGSTGSTCFWASWIRIRIHQSEVWIWIILSPSKKSKKNLDSYCFVTSF
jgi:hypothetical protein